MEYTRADLNLRSSFRFPLLTNHLYMSDSSLLPVLFSLLVRVCSRLVCSYVLMVLTQMKCYLDLET